MNDKVNEAYLRLKEEERVAMAHLETLRVQIRTLEMVGAVTANGSGEHFAASPAVPLPRPSNGLESQGIAPQRAPKGELPRVILALLKSTGPLTNAQIRDRLKQGGYQWALTPLHVSKTLTKLHKGKRVKAEGSQNSRTYRLPEK